MKANTKRVLALALAVMLMAIPLSACGGGGGGATAEVTPEFVYVPTYVTLPQEISDNGMNNPTYANGLLYFTMSSPVDKDGNPLTQEQVDKLNEAYQETYDAASSAMKEGVYDPGYTYIPHFYTIKTDGTGLTKLEGYKPVSTGSTTANLNCFCVDSTGNIWAVECTYESSGEGEGKETYYLRRLNADGSEISTTVLSDVIQPTGEYFYINGILCDKEGNVYLNMGDSGVAVLDANGQLLCTITDSGWINNITNLTDGSVAALCNGENGTSLKTIDIKTKGWGKEYKAPNDAYNMYPGGSDYDFCFTSNYSLEGYNTSTEESKEILNWINSDVDGDNVAFAMVMEDGNVLAVSNTWDEESSTSKSEIITMTKTPYSQVEKKTTLTLATMWLDYNLKGRIVNFNKTNPNYRIEIKDYSQYNTEKDYTAGLTKLNTEIISGNIPDLLDVSQLPYEQYAAKGLLEDLYTYIDADKQVTREAFIQSILKTMETDDGKLYSLAPTFSIQSMIGSPKVVGDEMGWTIEEMQQCLAEHPEADYPFGQYMSRDQILTYFCMMNMENYMNWETGECSFNSDEFKNMLTFAKSFPENIDYSEENNVNASELIANGRQLFEMYTAYDFQTQQLYKAMFGGAITYKGIPTEDRAGNLVALSGAISMTSSCKDKAGAWEFMRTLYLPEYQDAQYQMPIIQASFDKKLKAAMDIDKASGGGMSMDGFEVEFGPLTQDEADQLVAMINSVKHTAVYNESLMNIIKEESGAFFSGEKTVDQVADVIQSRMTIYINEQR